MQKKSAKKSQPKSKKPDPRQSINWKLDHMVEVLDRIEEMLTNKDEPEDSPDTPDEAA